MTDSPASALADKIEKALRDVDGITDIYASAPLPEVVATEVGAAVLLVEPAPLVTVEAGDEGMVVAVAIGVDDRTPAHVTGRAAHDRILDLLEAMRQQAHVTVRIATIAD